MNKHPISISHAIVIFIKVSSIGILLEFSKSIYCLTDIQHFSAICSWLRFSSIRFEYNIFPIFTFIKFNAFSSNRQYIQYFINIMIIRTCELFQIISKLQKFLNNKRRLTCSTNLLIILFK